LRYEEEELKVNEVLVRTLHILNEMLVEKDEIVEKLKI
jgi:hypothetical protein